MSTLTPRQQQVHDLLVLGQSTKQIAKTLGLSPNTVKDHCERLYAVLGVRNRWALLPPTRTDEPTPEGSPTIEAHACALLSSTLADVVRQRTALGVAKYGQRLDDNHQPSRARAVHLVQELLDAVQYALWLGDPRTASRCAGEAEVITRRYELTSEEIMAGGKV